MVNYLTFQIQQKQKTIEINDSKDINLWNKNSNIKKFQSERKEDLMWYNLIYIELNFNINSIIIFKKTIFFIDFYFHDKFLWDRRQHDSNFIKQFAVELIRSKVIKNGFEYENGVESLTKDCLDCKFIF